MSISMSKPMANSESLCHRTTGISSLLRMWLETLRIKRPESARELCGLLPLRGWRNAKANRYSPEVRERAVRMVAEHRDEYPSEWAAFTSIAGKFGMTPETLRIWVRRAQINEGCGQGRPLTSARS